MILEDLQSLGRGRRRNAIRENPCLPFVSLIMLFVRCSEIALNSSEQIGCNFAAASNIKPSNLLMIAMQLLVLEMTRSWGTVWGCFDICLVCRIEDIKPNT